MRGVYEKLLGLGRLAVLSTATTGLEPTDELIAVCVIDTAPDGDSELLMRDADRKKLASAYKWHGISSDMLSTMAINDRAFNSRLEDILCDYDAILTYNPAFQRKFIEVQTPPMISLPWLVKSTDNRLLVPSDLDDKPDLSGIQNLIRLQEASEAIGKLPSLKQMIRVFGTWEDDASNGLLPLECSAMDLLRLLYMMKDRVIS